MRTCARSERRGAAAVLAAAGLAGCASLALPGEGDAPFAPPGDASRGRATFVSREGGHCVLCHAIPGAAVAGDIGPSLEHVGDRLTAAQIRARIADITRFRPEAAMPAFHRTQGLTRVASAYAGKPLLSGEQVEDLVAFLATLR
jgi:L-cysteine S-thiosulfotransferase